MVAVTFVRVADTALRDDHLLEAEPKEYVLSVLGTRLAPNEPIEKAPEVILDALRFGMLDVAKTPIFENADALLATKPASPLIVDVLNELAGKLTVPAALKFETVAEAAFRDAHLFDAEPKDNELSVVGTTFVPNDPIEKAPEFMLDALRFGILDVARTPLKLDAAPEVAMAAKPLRDAAETEPAGKDTVPLGTIKPFPVIVPVTFTFKDIALTTFRLRKEGWSFKVLWYLEGERVCASISSLFFQ